MSNRDPLVAFLRTVTQAMTANFIQQFCINLPDGSRIDDQRAGCDVVVGACETKLLLYSTAYLYTIKLLIETFMSSGMSYNL